MGADSEDLKLLFDGIATDSLTETSTSDSDDSRVPRARIRKKKIKFRTRIPRRHVPSFCNPLVYRGQKKHRTFAVYPQFLSLDEIRRVHEFSTHETVKQIRDRTKKLTYQHIAYRVEMQARRLAPVLYDKMMHLVQWTDDSGEGYPTECFPSSSILSTTRDYSEDALDTLRSMWITKLLSPLS